MIDRRLLKNFDLPLLIATFCLIFLGMLIIFSATSKGDVSQHYVMKQINWFIFSLGIFVIVLSIHYESFSRWAYVLYFFSIILLLGVFFFPSIAGSKRWIILGQFRIQPAETAKLCVIFALAKYLKDKEGKINNFKGLIIPFLLVGIPIILILKQPDLGSALTFLPILFGMIYISGLSSLYVFILISPLLSFILYNFIYFWIIFLIIFGLILWWRCNNKIDFFITLFVNFFIGIFSPKMLGLLKVYQKKRLLSFLNPSLDPLGSGYHLIQSKIAIGSGGFWGKGFMAGTQTRLDFLPAPHTDFIFSVIGEELGFWGGLVVLSLFSFIILRGTDIAAKAKNSYGTLVAIGIVSVFTFHIIINIGMTIGLLPVTGIPLPLISYGGSSLLNFMIMIGLIINIGMRRFE